MSESDSENDSDYKSSGSDDSNDSLPAEVDIPEFPLSEQNLKESVDAVEILWKYGDEEGDDHDPDKLQKLIPKQFVPFISYFLDIATFCLSHPNQSPPQKYDTDTMPTHLFYHLLQQRRFFVDIWDYSIKMPDGGKLAAKYEVPSAYVKCANEEQESEFGLSLLESLREALQTTEACKDIEFDSDDEDDFDLEEEEEDGKPKKRKIGDNKNKDMEEKENKKPMSEYQRIIENLKSSGSISVLIKLSEIKSDNKESIGCIAKDILEKYISAGEATPSNPNKKAKVTE
ncbi:MAG: hypothetical protein EZS28_018572 [Streblomastix strix]|uniref:Uncharacterized protein n=1 Tax=Streblomastix strix TaxID=222440 RepID=A0A5J4VTE9_9EUKA|nr:MAG: hypothetical protein EZS28_018572 [Streblomastix strix]